MGTHFGGGRRRPYTTAGIERLTCARQGCTNKAYATWTVCADGNIYRPMCWPCDIALNKMVLTWFGDPDAYAKIGKYEKEHTP